MLSASDVRAALAHAGGLRVSWLGVAVAAEVMSLAGGAAAAAVCRWCIAALADRVRRAVLAGGLTSTVAVSGLLLAGAAVAGTGSLALLACAAGVLAAGTAG